LYGVSGESSLAIGCDQHSVIHTYSYGDAAKALGGSVVFITVTAFAQS
jgi:hypothetical protein